MPAVKTKAVARARTTIQEMIEPLKALPAPTAVEKRDVEPLPERPGL